MLKVVIDRDLSKFCQVVSWVLLPLGPGCPGVQGRPGTEAEAGTQPSQHFHVCERGRWKYPSSQVFAQCTGTVLGSTQPCTWLDAAGHRACTIILSLPETSLQPAGSFLSVTFLLLSFSLGQVLSLIAGLCRSRDGLFSPFELPFLLLSALILWEFHREIPERRNFISKTIFSRGPFHGKLSGQWADCSRYALLLK